MLSNSKKKEAQRAKDTGDGEDTHDEIADKIEEQKIIKKVKIAIHKTKISAGGFIRTWSGE